MRSSLLFLAPALLLSLVAAACGDGAAKPAATATVSGGATGSVTATASGTPAASSTPDFGPAPELGGNITKVSPAHATQVKQASTRTPDPTRPNGVCFEANFENTPEFGQWFRMAVDGKEVTTSITWILPTRENPTKGTACYAPAEGLTPGRHEAAVSVQNPHNPTEKPRQTIGWRFDVTP